MVAAQPVRIGCAAQDLRMCSAQTLRHAADCMPNPFTYDAHCCTCIQAPVFVS
jgi:hypothetical protein